MPGWAPSHAGGRFALMDAHPPLEIAAWGDQVVCAFAQRNRLVCAFFDGTKWGAPEPAGVPGYAAAMAHFEGRTVYLATTKGKVYRLDGKTWVEDSPAGGVGQGRLPYPGGSPTRLSVAGKVLVAIWTDGKRLVTSQKPRGGRWSRPREIFNEAVGVHWLGAPVRSVPNFVPLVWSVARTESRKPGGGPARFVRIPVTQPE